MTLHVSMQLVPCVEYFVAQAAIVLVGVGEVLRLKVVLDVVLHAEVLAAHGAAKLLGNNVGHEDVVVHLYLQT